MAKGSGGIGLSSSPKGVGRGESIEFSRSEAGTSFVIGRLAGAERSCAGGAGGASCVTMIGELFSLGLLSAIGGGAFGGAGAGRITGPFAASLDWIVAGFEIDARDSGGNALGCVLGGGVNALGVGLAGISLGDAGVILPGVTLEPLWHGSQAWQASQASQPTGAQLVGGQQRFFAARFVSRREGAPPIAIEPDVVPKIRSHVAASWAARKALPLFLNDMSETPCVE